MAAKPRSGPKRGVSAAPRGTGRPRVLSDAEMRALVRLLGDADLKTARIARRHLERQGERTFPYLGEGACGRDPRVRARSRLLLDRLQFDSLLLAAREYGALPDDEMDLEYGALLVARFGAFALDMFSCSRQLDRMAADLAPRLASYDEMDNILDVIKDYLFSELGFAGDRETPRDPQNSYLDRVLDRRRGLPISLSVVYLLVGQRLGLPVHGVGMPGHFLVRYDGPDETVWIDAFEGGLILERADCTRRLRALGYRYEASYLEPVSHRMIVARMLANLIRTFAHAQEEVHVRRLTRLLEAVVGGT